MKCKIYILVFCVVAALALANGANYFGRETAGNESTNVKCDVYLNTLDSILTGQAVTLSYGSLEWACGYTSFSNQGKFKVVVYNITGTDTGNWYCVDSSGLITRTEDNTVQWDSAAFSGYTTSADSSYAVGFALNAFMVSQWCYDDVIIVRSRKNESDASIRKDVACTGTEPLIISPLNDSITVVDNQWCVKASYSTGVTSQVIVVSSLD